MLNFQDMIAALTHFWAEKGCLVHQGYDLEVGAGTFNPATFLRCQGPEPYSAVYVEPSRRPKDGRYGQNPNRVQFYHQMQVILKPSPPDIQDLYLQSLERIGLDLSQHDIRFVHDDWENPTIGAWGLGWEVWADGMEVTQFTYFQAVGGLPVKPVSGELTYGLERLALYIQGVDSFFDLKWNDEVTYGDIFQRSEWEWSHYNFNESNAKMWLSHFEDFEAESLRLIEKQLPIPAYDFVMKCSHAFNMLDARGVISVTERTGYIGRIRNLARLLAESYLKSREEQKFPLMRNHRETAPVSHPLKPSTVCSPDEKQDFLLEIGSEELPATFVPLGMESLKTRMEQFLTKEGLSYKSLKVYGTPRRLAVYVEDLAGGVRSVSHGRKGPTLAAAYDENGKLTAAGQGFFRSLNLEPPARSDAATKKFNDIDYLFYSPQIPDKSTRELLARELPALILNIDFPKKMRWGSLDIEYARPLRWIVALYGNEVIPFVLGNVLSGNETRGHRQLAHKTLSISHPNKWLEKLRDNWVMADVAERKQMILEELGKIEAQLKATALVKEKVLAQVLHLVEWPFLTTETFDQRFLQAPKEVLVSEMVEHQKYFPLANEAGSLLPYFAIVCNNTPTDLIRKGNQKALSPRLADGMFLYETDLKVPLEQFNEKLKTVTFQKDLGSVWAKVQRMSCIAERLHVHLPICPLEKVKRAIELCKADLASELVGEFPELQGMVGKLYALKHGEDPVVAEAIDEHWMPRGEKAPLPQSPCGVLVSLSEKIDNLFSCFALDLKPTSSSDPYALRRQALGILKSLIDHAYYLPLNKILKETAFCFLKSPELSQKAAEKIRNEKEILFSEIEGFLINRLRTVFRDYGFEHDEIEAVLTPGLSDVYDQWRKLSALKDFRQTHPDAFAKALEVYTRVKKILVSQKPGLIPEWRAHRLGTHATPENRFPPLKPDLLQEEAETGLYEKITEMKKALHAVFADRKDPKNHNYSAAFLLLVELYKPVSLLFEKVKVLAEDPQVQENRLSLLQEVWDLFEELADFSKIQNLN